MRERFVRFFALFRRDSDIDAELQSHLDMAIDRHMLHGMSAAEARRQALIDLGGVEQSKEAYRDQRSLPLLETTLQDLRYGFRTLARNPGFTIVAVLSLALGIGANTAIFTLIDAVLLKMLPVKDPQSLILLQWSAPQDKSVGAHSIDGYSWDENGLTRCTSFSYHSFAEMRGRARSLRDAFAFGGIGDHLNVIVNGDAELARGQLTSWNSFSMLGVDAQIGRVFAAADDRANSPPVCILSDAYWKRRLGGSADAVGKSIMIGGTQTTIIGVAPASFQGIQPGDAPDIWQPLASLMYGPTAQAEKYTPLDADHFWLQIMARVKPGVTVAQASAELRVLFPRTVTLEKDDVMPAIEITPGGQGIDQLRRQFTRTLYILMSVVGVVLLIACANVANLLLARSSARQKEIGVRLSLGASRGRIVRQLLTESVLLAALGGALGMLFAYAGSRTFLALWSRPDFALRLNLSPDLRILAFTAVACLGTGLLFGLAPALRATRVDVQPALQSSVRGAGQSGVGLAKALVVLQVALSIVLLFGAGLFVRTLMNLRHIDTGFAQENVLLFGINPSRAGYPASSLKDFYARVEQRLSALPGVTSASSSLHLLLSGASRGNQVYVPGSVAPPGTPPDVKTMPAGPAFFATMGIPLLRGRAIAPSDTETSPKVVVINETLAKRFFGERDPIGRLIGWDSSKADMTIVGVVKDARYDSLRRDAPATVYQPVRQADRVYWMHFEVRTTTDPKALIPSVRAAMASLDRNIPLFDVKTQSQQLDEALTQERLFAKLAGFFGLLALALACIGLYGIMSYAVVRRTAEMGIRMALGARPAGVLAMILRESLVLVALGVALGVPAVLLLSRYAERAIADLLYGLPVADPATLGMAVAILVAVALIAGFIPARRASQVDPMVALRYE